MSTLAAVDLGASSGRVITGTLDRGILRMRHEARFANSPVRLPDGLHWDVLSLYSSTMAALGRASRAHSDLVSVAVDSWAVDYALLRDGRLLGNPYHYRDIRNFGGVRAVHARIGPEELFRRNGLQHLPFNTIFQLAASQRVGDLVLADRMLLIPDLIGYWATGAEVAEHTNASTTGLVKLGESTWDRGLAQALGLRAALLPDIVEPGTNLGAVRAAVGAEFGVGAQVTFTTVGSHDTASAVVGVPSSSEDSAYISCGTWALVGTELSSPAASEAARRSGFTNEYGVDGRTRFLKNVMGLWLLSESIAFWSRESSTSGLETLLKQAAAAPSDVPTFDVSDERLLAPGNIPSRIAQLLSEAGARPLQSPGEMTRSILQSLANAFAATLSDIERVTSKTLTTVHLVGGGARNELLCQLTADAVGLPVVAGPVEATAIGNLLVQARTLRLVDGDLDALRAVVRSSFPARTFVPTP